MHQCTVNSVKGFCSDGYKPGDYFSSVAAHDRAGTQRGVVLVCTAGAVPYLTAYCSQTRMGWINMKTELNVR
jgi:hypothetical protein